MTQSVDVGELVACARYGELAELQEEVARRCSDHSGWSTSKVLALADPQTGNTALHMAAANGHADVVQYLLEHLATPDVNARNSGGNTALHWCAVNGHLQVAEMLIKAGASVTAKNDAGKTPIYDAQLNGHEKVVDMLLQHVSAEEAESAAGADDDNAQE
ncbi:ankyrin repeat-containing protein [Sorochytrium milnesiophthora]